MKKYYLFDRLNFKFIVLVDYDLADKYSDKYSKFYFSMDDMPFPPPINFWDDIKIDEEVKEISEKEAFEIQNEWYNNIILERVL